MKLSKLLRLMLGLMYADEPAPAGTPAPTPTPTPTPAPAAGGNEGEGDDFDGAEENIDWGAMNADVQPGADDEGDGAPAGTGTPTQAKATQPTGTEVEAKKTTIPETPPEVTDPSQLTPEAKAKAAADAQQQPAQTPEQRAAEEQKFREWEDGEVAKMAEQYASTLTEDDVASLQTEPEKILPKLAARIRMDTMKATISAIGQLMPNLLSGHQVSMNLEKQAQDAFFGKNEDLRDVPMQTILQAGQAYRQMNPNVKDPEEVIEGVGNMVRAVLKRNAKTAAPTPTPAPAGKKKGYTPAGTGGTNASNEFKAVDKSVWSELADD